MENTTRKGTIKSISDGTVLKGLGGANKDISKREVAIELNDKENIFVDVIGNKLSLLEGLESEDYVEVTYSYRGSTKKGINYNNLYCHNLKKL